MRLIDADVLRSRIKQWQELEAQSSGRLWNEFLHTISIVILRIIDEAPTEPSEKPARWVLHDVCCREQYECSRCHVRFIYDDYDGCDQWNFCPECGANMDVRRRR